MQAIILAAGMGTRLKEKTADVPKSLVEVNGVPILVRMLDTLEKLGVGKVTLVCGYKSEVLRERMGTRYGHIAIEYVENQAYRETNNIYSLYLTRECVREDTLLIEGDVLVKPECMEALCRAEDACSVVTSPFDPATMNGTVMVCSEAGWPHRLVLKKHQRPGTDPKDVYKTVNVYKMTADFFNEKLIPTLQYVMAIEGKNVFYEMGLGVLMTLAPADFGMQVISPQDWFEVDDEGDLQAAEKGISAWG